MTQQEPDTSWVLGLRQETAGQWTVLHVSGEMDAATAPQLRECVITAAAAGIRCLVLDLSAVGFMDSTALGVLVGADKRLRTLDGHLRLVVTSPMSLRVLTMTGLDRVFEVFPTLPAALHEP